MTLTNDAGRTLEISRTGSTIYLAIKSEDRHIRMRLTPDDALDIADELDLLSDHARNQKGSEQ